MPTEQANTPYSRPAFSVCVASYNGSDYIAAQIESIIAQLGPDDELIIVDDASTDATYEIACEAAATLPPGQRQLVRSRMNEGHTATFVKAIGLARKPLVTLSDQDDLWPAGRLNALAECVESYDVDLAFGSLLTFGRPPIGLLRNKPGTLDGVIGLVRHLLSRSRFCFGSASAFRRQAIRTDIPVLTETYEDWLIGQALVGSGVAFIDKVVTNRRLHARNLTRRRPFAVRTYRRLQSAVAITVVMLRARK